MMLATAEQLRLTAAERDYEQAVGRLRGVALRLLWRTVRRDPVVLAEYIQEAREALATIETLAEPRRRDVTVVRGRRAP